MAELIAAVLSEDEQGKLSLAFHLDDLALQTHRVDRLLHALVHARAAMQPPARREPPRPGEQVLPIVDPAWQADPLPDGAMLLSLHHPALGWVSWLFPKQMAQDLALGLHAVAGAAVQPSGPVQ